MKHSHLTTGIILISTLLSSQSNATDGYFSHGYGVKSQATGGVGIALAQDSLVIASNPAGAVWLDDRLDAGLSWFGPTRSTDITDSKVPGANGHYEGNDTKNFWLPEFGYIKRLSSNTTLGLAVYGNGGMNTDYKKSPFTAFGIQGNTGINLEQLFISPSLAYKIDENHSIGAAVNLAYQRFSAKGINIFSPSSITPANVSDQGTDTSTGIGIRLGWTGKLNQDITLGATWASKTNTSGFDRYRGLFADGGSFDIPENYGIGIAIKTTPLLTLAADLQQIKYSRISAVSNPLSNLFSGNPLGAANGPGFGWRDVTVFKAGAVYEYNSTISLRAGYNHSSQPIPAEQTFFNILAPGVVQNHLTLGSTFKTGNGEISFALTHGFNKSVNGSNSIPGVFGGGNANVALRENIIGIAYGLKL
ncbi:OmpP1/FadL family transporter [Undibacterium sp. SXout7W]|uniref:OmpP1/FadL family transporter n=1 Tax=Undibacterium sp. SXout7W TaxID=3413049 RepID=UPI003BF1EE95